MYIILYINNTKYHHFSILGMNLFGCKFCEKVNGEKICDRKNFDSLLWALVTVFQVDLLLSAFTNLIYLYINNKTKFKLNTIQYALKYIYIYIHIFYIHIYIYTT